MMLNGFGVLKRPLTPRDPPHHYCPRPQVALEWLPWSGGSMRRVSSLILYLAMVVVGIIVLGWILFFANGGRGVIFTSGGFLLIFGAYLLWTDFIRQPNV
jgi:predicted membrane channel-forming protein YqfA (hemolysin III family)